jgi:hypothetical protein
VCSAYPSPSPSLPHPPQSPCTDHPIVCGTRKYFRVLPRFTRAWDKGQDHARHASKQFNRIRRNGNQDDVNRARNIYMIDDNAARATTQSSFTHTNSQHNGQETNAKSLPRQAWYVVFWPSLNNLELIIRRDGMVYQWTSC